MTNGNYKFEMFVFFNFHPPSGDSDQLPAVQTSADEETEQKFSSRQDSFRSEFNEINLNRCVIIIVIIIYMKKMKDEQKCVFVD